MNRRLFGCMLRLMFPPQSSAGDTVLVEAINRNTCATNEVLEKAGKIDRALANIHEATEGLFA